LRAGFAHFTVITGRRDIRFRARLPQSPPHAPTAHIQQASHIACFAGDAPI